jgi:beta-phosphoglucomutase-like phosphatase (HAD superfamily)
VSALAAVVFDFDGVLADSEPLHLEAYRIVVGKRGLTIQTGDYYARFMGYNDEDALEAMSHAYGWRLTPDAIERIVEEKLAETRRLLASPGVLYDVAVACVHALAARVPLAIASGAKREEIELVLGAAGLAGAFAAIVASGETPRSKPAPDPYARAVSLLRAQGRVPEGNGATSRCVAIEDSRWGVQSAVDAGLRCVAVTTTSPREDLERADLVVESLQAVTPERLEALIEGGA